MVGAGLSGQNRTTAAKLFGLEASKAAGGSDGDIVGSNLSAIRLCGLRRLDGQG